MNVIEALVTTLTLDASGYEAGTKRAKKAEKELNDELGKTKKQTDENTKSQDKASKSLFAFTQKVIETKKALLGLAEVYVGVKIFKNIIEDVSQAEASLYRLSGRINTSAQDLQAWGNAAEIMGGSADEARQGLQALSTDLTALRYKGEPSGRTNFIAQMGVDVKDSHGKMKSLIQIQEELGNAMEKRVKSGAMTQEDMTNLASSAGFDDSTVLLLTAERKEREEILKDQKEFNELTQANAKESRDLSREWIKFKQQIFALKSHIFHTFAPLLNFLMWIAVATMHVINFFGKFSGVVGALLLVLIPLRGILTVLRLFGVGLSWLTRLGGVFGGVFRSAFGGIFSLLGKLARSIWALLSGVGKLGGIFTRLFGVVTSGAGAIGRLLAPFLRLISMFMRFGMVLQILRHPLMIFAAIVGFLIKDLRDFGRNGKSWLDWAKIFDGIHDAIEWFGALGDKLGDVWDKIKNNDWAGAWESIKNIFSGGDSTAIDGAGGDMSAIVSSAQSEIGVSETANRDTVMGYQQDIGYNARQVDAWCASFVGSRLKKAGYQYLKSASASDYMNYGTAIDKNGAIPAGAVGLKNRNGGSGKHVFIIEKDNGDGTVTAINGNWGGGVKRDIFKKSELAGVRMPVSNGGQSSETSQTGATVAKGSLATNQQEAYQSARQNGLSDTAAKALVANMSGEALHKPTDRHWDGSHYAHGIVQWSDDRAKRIQQQFGKMPQNMSVAEQTKAAIWEIQKHYPTTWKALQGGGNAEGMIGTLVKDFERPADSNKAIRQRVSHLRGLKVTNPMTQPVKPATNRRLYAQTNNNNHSNGSSNSYNNASAGGLMASNASHNEVSIGQVVIHTAATDSHGIARSIPSALSNSMAGLAFNMDMGQA